MVLNEAQIFGVAIAQTSTRLGAHTEDIDIDVCAYNDLVEEPLRHVLRGIVAVERHLWEGEEDQLGANDPRLTGGVDRFDSACLTGGQLVAGGECDAVTSDAAGQVDKNT